MNEPVPKLGGQQTGPFMLQALLVSIIFLMAFWGCLAIYNATAYSNEPFLFAGKQLLWLAICTAVMFIVASAPFKSFAQNIRVISILAFSSLLLVLFIGVKINSMKGWFDLGFLHIQPSEISKPFFMLSLCAAACSAKNNMSLYIRTTALTATWCIPLAFQPDFGTIAVYLAGYISVYIISGGSMLMLIPNFACLAAGVAAICLWKPYVAGRIAGFIFPEQLASGPGWHVLQFQYTMARGGLSGQSWGRSLWANSYLPLSYSDSTFASIVEAIGFLGAVPIIIGFCALPYISCKLAAKTSDKLQAIFIISMTMSIAFQALLHMSVNVTMLPVTGITLPVISYGGSSLLATFIGLGLVLSASGKG